MDEIAALSVGCCLSPFCSLVSMFVPVLLLLLTPHVRKKVLPGMVSRPGGYFWLLVWIPLLPVVVLSVIIVAAVAELALLLFSILLTTNANVLGFIVLYSAGPVEETAKAAAGAFLFLLFVLISGRKGMLVREVLFFGAVVGIGFGTVEAMLYLTGDIPRFLLAPGLMTLDAVVWRVAFGALVHAQLAGLALAPLGLRDNRAKVLVLVSTFLMGQYHGMLNLMNMPVVLWGESIPLALAVDAVQFIAIVFLLLVFVAAWAAAKPDVEGPEDPVTHDTSPPGGRKAPREFRYSR